MRKTLSENKTRLSKITQLPCHFYFQNIETKANVVMHYPSARNGAKVGQEEVGQNLSEISGNLGPWVYLLPSFMLVSLSIFLSLFCLSSESNLQVICLHQRQKSSQRLSQMLRRELPYRKRRLNCLKLNFYSETLD